jgi:hypothetical protein
MYFKWVHPIFSWTRSSIVHSVCHYRSMHSRFGWTKHEMCYNRLNLDYQQCLQNDLSQWEISSDLVALFALGNLTLSYNGFVNTKWNNSAEGLQPFCQGEIEVRPCDINIHLSFYPLIDTVWFGDPLQGGFQTWQRRETRLDADIEMADTRYSLCLKVAPNEKWITFLIFYWKPIRKSCK